MTKQKFITLEQASEIYQMSVAALRRRIDEGQLPAYKPGKSILLKPEEVDLFMQRKKIKAS